jgi:hypothetical protein
MRLLDVDVKQLDEAEAFLRRRMLPLKYFPAFYVIKRFNTTFTTAPIHWQILS